MEITFVGSPEEWHATFDHCAPKNCESESFVRRNILHGYESVEDDAIRDELTHRPFLGRRKCPKFQAEQN
ncbi:MAG: hypothetical protein IKO05_11870 [Selenomonadaceae bacterium]|nr:hypothetical protein [Selenomonadaceae bacterium]